MSTSTEHAVAAGLGGMLVNVFLIFVVSIFVGFQMKQKRGGTKFVWWPTLAAIPVALLVAILGFANIGGEVKAQDLEVADSNREVFVFENPFPGERFADLSDEQLRAIEKSADARTKVMLNGLGQSSSPLASKATPTVVNGMYAVQIVTRRGPELISFAVIGLVGKTLVDIHCVPADKNRATFRFEGSDCQKTANERLVRSPAS